MKEKTIVVVQGASGPADVPGIDKAPADVQINYAGDAISLQALIPDAEVLLGWDFRDGALSDIWDRAERLKWVQWAGAGVDAVIFPKLAASDVVLTNMRGVFDHAMAEYVLGLLIAMAKRVPETLRCQALSKWNYRLTPLMQGHQALIVGVGSIGREIGRMLAAFGLQVSGVGRTHREHDDDFAVVYGVDELHAALAVADYVVVVVPSTAESRGMFGAAEFNAMKPGAYFVNVARGNIIDEQALVEALQREQIAGAALDVFKEEPLPEGSALWALDNVIVSPHMSGDYFEAFDAMTELFLDNLERYGSGRPLRNVVDKSLGFVP